MGLIAIMASTSYGQHETLFSKARIIGGFGGPILEFGNIKGEYTPSVGGGGGLIIDNFFVGFYGMGSIDPIQDNISGRGEFEMDLAHGGLWLGYTPFTFKMIHPYASAKIGWGFADIREDLFTINSTGDGIFVITPEVGMEVNLTRYFRIGASVGYRIVSDVDQLPGLTNKDFSSLSGQLTFRFGWFGRAKSQPSPDDFN